MALHRRFVTMIVNGTFEINEIPGTEVHPTNWNYGEYPTLTTREGAWARATSQDRPVVVMTLDGQEQALGIVFNPEAFERAAYQGYVSYGLSMTDGWYSPESFESWVIGFRKHPQEYLARENDASDEVKGAVLMYQAMLAAA